MCPAAHGQKLQLVGAAQQPVELKPEASSGLDAVYVVRTTAGLSAKFTAPAGTSSLTWSAFGSAGGAYAEPVDATRDGDTWTISSVRPDTGYLIDYADGRRYYFWVTDWSAHPYDVTDVRVGEADCSSTQLLVSGSAPRITYYSINGRGIEIDREISVDYTSLEWNQEAEQFVPVDRTEHRAWLPDNFYVPAPLCETSFTLSGDRFLAKWGGESHVTTERVSPVAIDCHTEAVPTEREIDNEQKVDGLELGGSAPAEISFRAAVTDAAIFKEWQIAPDAEFDLVDFSSSDLVTDYTFRDAGTFYVRFVAANADATCEYTSETYTVTIGESNLQIPNAFSPGSSEGVNDIWKVSYKSIVKFECHIFNKWGVKLYEFTDPADGWDGKYKGKLVPPGAYYYVIKATGADGRNWDRAGDINIVGYK